MLAYLMAGVSHSFVPQTKKRRTAMHSFAAVCGVAGAIRMDAAHAIVPGVLWYTGFFFFAHVVVVPFIAAFLMARARMVRFVRGIVEEELISFDLRTYQRQFHRVFPKMNAPEDEDTV